MAARIPGRGSDPVPGTVGSPGSGAPAVGLFWAGEVTPNCGPIPGEGLIPVEGPRLWWRVLRDGGLSPAEWARPSARTPVTVVWARKVAGKLRSSAVSRSGQRVASGVAKYQRGRTPRPVRFLGSCQRSADLLFASQQRNRIGQTQLSFSRDKTARSSAQYLLFI